MSLNFLEAVKGESEISSFGIVNEEIRDSRDIAGKC